MSLRILLVSIALCPFVQAAAPAAGPGVTAEEALTRLVDGNHRFQQGATTHPSQDAARRVETAAGQKPFATVLSCADSRVPTEVLFDQGIGDLFVIRVAGNVATTNEIASIDYATEFLHAPLCVVLGHSRCGAVKAAVDGAELHGELAALLAEIAPAAERARRLHPGLKGEALLAAAVEENVWCSIESLFERSAAVRAAAAAGKLRVVGAVYDLGTGSVRWLGEHPRQAQFVAEHAPSAVRD